MANFTIVPKFLPQSHRPHPYRYSQPELDRHEDTVKESITRKSMAVGIMNYSRKGLEKRRAKNEKVSASVVGMLVISDDVSPELASETIESIKVLGVLRASKAVRQVLADRIK